MKNASESLTDVRRWICDNLSNGDAGKLCNMLSSVSRYISEIEMKNERLRCNYVDKVMYISALEQKIVCMDDESAKLRKLALDVHALHWSGLDCTECPWIGECDTDGGCPWLGIMSDHMQELGIEVPR